MKRSLQLPDMELALEKKLSKVRNSRTRATRKRSRHAERQGKGFEMPQPCFYTEGFGTSPVRTVVRSGVINRICGSQSRAKERAPPQGRPATTSCGCTVMSYHGSRVQSRDSDNISNRGWSAIRIVEGNTVTVSLNNSSGCSSQRSEPRIEVVDPSLTGTGCHAPLLQCVQSRNIRRVVSVLVLLTSWCMVTLAFAW